MVLLEQFDLATGAADGSINVGGGLVDVFNNNGLLALEWEGYWKVLQHWKPQGIHSRFRGSLHNLKAKQCSKTVGKELAENGVKIAELVHTLMVVELSVDIVKDFPDTYSISGRQHGFTIERPTVYSFNGLRANEERVLATVSSVDCVLTTGCDAGEGPEPPHLPMLRHIARQSTPEGLSRTLGSSPRVTAWVMMACFSSSSSPTSFCFALM